MLETNGYSPTDVIRDMPYILCNDTLLVLALFPLAAPRLGLADQLGISHLGLGGVRSPHLLGLGQYSLVVASLEGLDLALHLRASASGVRWGVLPTHFSSLVLTKGTLTSWPARFSAAAAAAARASMVGVAEAAGCVLRGWGTGAGFGAVFGAVFVGWRNRDMAALPAGVPVRDGCGVGVHEWEVACRCGGQKACAHASHFIGTMSTLLQPLR